MWLYLTFLLIIGSAVADHHHAWETENEYHFLIQSRTLTVLNNLADQFSGILMKGGLTVQVKSSDTLQAIVSETQYAPVHRVLSEGWNSEITDLEFHELSLSGKPFEIKLEQGVIRDVLVDQDVPIWEVNLLKSIVSQLQIDTEGKNVISRNSREKERKSVPNDNQPFGSFKVMEDSVGGKCEVLYNITLLPEDVLLKNPELVPLPNLRENGHHINIIKTKNYTRCEQQMAYHSGIVGKMNWKPVSNNGLLLRSSTSHISISGNTKRFTIQSSVTTNIIQINSKIHNTYSGSVYSSVNLTLDSISKISNPMPASNNLVSTGNLVYTYNNPFSSQRKSRYPSVSQSSLEDRSSESRNSNNSTEESSSSSSSLNFNREEHSYLQPIPKLNDAPENPLLPYFVGYKGKSIHNFEENLTAVAADMINEITRQIEHLPNNILHDDTLSFIDILEPFTILVRLIRTMNVEQMSEIENKLSEMLHRDHHTFSSEENQKLYNQTAWDVFHNAVTHAGTGPALITIKNWIKNKKLEGIQAAHIISQIPKVALTPTAEYVQTFFELITDEQVRNQRFVNTTAPLSFAELIRYTHSNKQPIYYPVYSFGSMSKYDKALLETYISYMATQLREAIKEGDNPRIQTYIMALGNFGHVKVLSVFEPYLEGTLPISKFQRLMMVISLNRLSENFPRIAKSVAYKIYVNVMEAYELRCAAVYVIMKTNPPLSMLQRMADFTNQDQDKHVNSAVKTSIDALANMKQPEMQDLANKACIAQKLLNPDCYTENNSSRSIITEANYVSLNIAQTSILQTIGSDDINIPKGIYMDIHQSYSGFSLPPLRATYAISNLRELLDMWYQMPWNMEYDAENKLIIEETIEKLGIKAEDPEQIEGNIYMDSMFISEFYPFDNHTFEEIANMLKMYLATFKSPRVFESTNKNRLFHYDMTLGFPTESGLPFIYTLTIPKLMRISGGGSHTVTKSSSAQTLMELAAAGHVLINEKIQSRIGFVTPFEHRHYIAGIDINSQLFMPVGLSVTGGYKKKFELKINVPDYRYGAEHIAIHYSVVPYTAIHNILSFKSILDNDIDMLLVNVQEPHEIKFSLNDAILTVKSDFIDDEASKKTGIAAFNDIYKVFIKPGAYYKRFDVILPLTKAQINVTASDTFMMYDVNSTEATIPAIVDKRPESDARKEQFLIEVSKNVDSASSYVYDISIFNEHNYQVFTLALANSYVNDKSQALFYWNTQLDNGKVLLEFCTIGYKQSSQNIPLNFKEAKDSEKIPKYEFKAEMRFGSCMNGDTIKLKGNWTRTDDVKEMVMKSELAEKCLQEIKQGNIWLPTCQRANELIREKNHLMMSIDTDSDKFSMLANRLFFWIKMLAPEENVKMLEFANTNKNTIDLEIKMPPDNYDAKISLSSSMMNITFSLTDFFESINFDILKPLTYLEEDSEGSVCVLDKTQVVTFDEKIYPLKLGNCWHVMTTTYPKRHPNNPEETLRIPKYIRMMVMAREMGDGSKQIRMILNNREIHLQKSGSYLEAMVDDQLVLSYNESYREGTFEIYQLDGIITIFSREYEIYAAYDGERILLRSSYKYINTVRGLCGNYDMRSDNDFIAPKNCILTNPEEFTATYALTYENCEGPALQNKRKAEQSTCSQKSYRPGDVINDMTRNRRWGYH